MITASHNPAEYNGYKVYGDDGCQITDNAAKATLREIEKVDYFAFDESKQKSKGAEILSVPNSLYESYLDKISDQKCGYDCSFAYSGDVVKAAERKNNCRDDD